MARISRTEILQDFRTRSLLEAARKVIALQGFDAATMERIAGEAGITKGAIYLYFSNKDQLMLTAIEEIASEMVREIEKRVNGSASPWERICQIARAQLEIMERHQDLLRTLALDRRFLHRGPQKKRLQRLLVYRERHEGRIREILDEGVGQNCFPPMDTGKASFYIDEMIISTSQRRMLGSTRSSLAEDTEALLRFLALLLSTGGTSPSQAKEGI